MTAVVLSWNKSDKSLTVIFDGIWVFAILKSVFCVKLLNSCNVNSIIVLIIIILILIISRNSSSSTHIPHEGNRCVRVMQSSKHFLQTSLTPKIKWMYCLTLASKHSHLTYVTEVVRVLNQGCTHTPLSIMSQLWKCCIAALTFVFAIKGHEDGNERWPQSMLRCMIWLYVVV